MAELSANPQANPVFSYRAGFRRNAVIIQRWAVLLGVTCLVVGGATMLVAVDGSRVQKAGGWQCLAGSGLLLAGVAWGFWWRGYLRAEFRRRFTIERR